VGDFGKAGGNGETDSAATNDEVREVAFFAGGKEGEVRGGGGVAAEEA